MNYCVGIDVSLEASSICVLDGDVKIIREDKVASEPEEYPIGTAPTAPAALAQFRSNAAHDPRSGALHR